MAFVLPCLHVQSGTPMSNKKKKRNCRRPTSQPAPTHPPQAQCKSNCPRPRIECSMRTSPRPLMQVPPVWRRLLPGGGRAAQAGGGPPLCTADPEGRAQELPSGHGRGDHSAHLPGKLLGGSGGLPARLSLVFFSTPSMFRHAYTTFGMTAYRDACCHGIPCSCRVGWQREGRMPTEAACCSGGC